MSTSGKPRIGFIGLGAIGSVICRRVVEGGYPVKAYDLRREAVEKAASFGAQPAASLADVAKDVDVIMLSVPDDRVVREVLFGDGGVVSTLAQNSLIIDTSTCRPLVTRQTAAELAEMGFRFIDAPVSGGVRRAETGTLSVIVGGEAADVEEARPILSTFGNNIFHVGGHGNGHLAKALNNMLSGATLALSAEVAVLGVKAGIDPGVLIEVINNSTGRSNSTEVKFPRFILNRKFNAGFSMGLMAKDLGITTDLAAELKVPIFGCNMVKQLFDYAITRGGAELDHTAIITYLEEWSDVVVQSDYGVEN